jgi:hypothetical protein
LCWAAGDRGLRRRQEADCRECEEEPVQGRGTRRRRRDAVELGVGGGCGGNDALEACGAVTLAGRGARAGQFSGWPQLG